MIIEKRGIYTTGVSCSYKYKFHFWIPPFAAKINMPFHLENLSNVTQVLVWQFKQKYLAKFS